MVGERDDRRLDAVGARAAVEDQSDLFAEVLGDMLCRGRADAAEAVGRWRGDAVAAQREESLQQRLCDRMSRNAQSHAVPAAGDGVVHVACARKDQRQRPGPEGCRQRFGTGRNRSGPARQRGSIGDVHDHRVLGWAPLGREDPPHRVGIAGVGAQPVHRFGGKGHQLAVAQHSGRAIDVFRSGRNDHGCGAGPAPEWDGTRAPTRVIW